MTFLITLDIRGNKNIGLQLQGWVKEPFLKRLKLPHLQRSGNFSDLIERLHKSLNDLAKNIVASFRKCADRLSIPAALLNLGWF